MAAAELCLLLIGWWSTCLSDYWLKQHDSAAVIFHILTSPCQPVSEHEPPAGSIHDSVPKNNCCLWIFNPKWLPLRDWATCISCFTAVQSTFSDKTISVQAFHCYKWSIYGTIQATHSLTNILTLKSCLRRAAVLSINRHHDPPHQRLFCPSLYPQSTWPTDTQTCAQRLFWRHSHRRSLSKQDRPGSEC